MGKNQIQELLESMYAYGCRNNNEKEYINSLIGKLNQINTQFINMTSYVNNVMNSNISFYSLEQFRRYVYAQKSKINYNDPKNQSLDSIMGYLDRMCSEFLNIQSEYNNMVNPGFAQNNNYSNTNIYQNEDEDENIQMGKVAYKAVYIIGLVMVLIGLVIFGKYVYLNMLNDFVKGMILYALGILVLVLNECIIKKKNIAFSRGLVVFCTAELIASTAINFLTLKNFNCIVSIIIVFFISLLAIIYSFKEKSWVVRTFALVLSTVGLVLSSVGVQFNVIDCATVIVYILIINIMSFVLPIKCNKNAIDTMIVFNGITNLFVLCWCEYGMDDIFVTILSVFFFVFAFCIDKFIIKESRNIFNEVTLLLCLGVLLCQHHAIYLYIAVAVVSLIGFIVSKSNIKEKYLICSLAMFCMVSVKIDMWNYIPVWCSSLVIAFCLILLNIYSNKRKSGFITFISIFLTIVLVCVDIVKLLYYNVQFEKVSWGIFSPICMDMFSLIVLGIGLCIIYRKKDSLSTLFKYFTLFGVILLGNVISNSTNKQISTLVVIGVIYFIVILMYGIISPIRNKTYKIDNFVMVLVMQLMWIFCIFSKSISSLIYASICMASTILICNDRFCDIVKSVVGKCIYLNVFVSFFVVHIYLFADERIWGIWLIDSIIIIVASVDIFIGIKKKRLTCSTIGLVLYMLLPLKIIFIDCKGLSSTIKTALFILFGVIIIIIAFIYSLMIKKQIEQSKKINVGQSNQQYNNGQYDNMQYSNQQYQNGQYSNEQYTNYQNRK